MDAFQFIASLISSLAWPVIVLAAMLVFRSQLGDLFGRVRSVKALGAEGTFDPKVAEASVALAAATAAASVQATSVATFDHRTTFSGKAEPLSFPSNSQVTERLITLANRDPQGAVLEAYAQVERSLKARMITANVGGVEKLQGQELLDVALRAGVINRETAEAMRGILVLRNLAAHERDVSLEKALDYLSLADAVLYSIEVIRAYAGAAAGTGRAFDATVKITDETL